MRIIGQQWAHSKPLLSWNRTQAAETCPSQGIKPLTGNYNWKEQPQSWFSTYSLRSSCCRSNQLSSKEVFLRTRNKWPGAKNYHNGAKFWPKVANKGIQKNGAFLSITVNYGSRLVFFWSKINFLWLPGRAQNLFLNGQVVKSFQFSASTCFKAFQLMGHCGSSRLGYTGSNPGVKNI